MQPELGLSVTEAARRAQILSATVDTLAEYGYARASFERIRERAGLSSTRIITYHFGTKSDLMNAVLGTIVHVKDQFTAQRRPAGRAELLRAHIEAEVAFLCAHPDAVRALEEVRLHTTGDPITEALVMDLRAGRMERQLRQGRQEGVFGEFAPEVMARTIAHALDGAAAALSANPDLDLTAYGRELADLFERATRA